MFQKKNHTQSYESKCLQFHTLHCEWKLTVHTMYGDLRSRYLFRIIFLTTYPIQLKLYTQDEKISILRILNKMSFTRLFLLNLIHHSVKQTTNSTYQPLKNSWLTMGLFAANMTCWGCCWIICCTDCWGCWGCWGPGGCCPVTLGGGCWKLKGPWLLKNGKYVKSFNLG